MRSKKIGQGRYVCWNGPDCDDSAPYLGSTLVAEATRLHGIYIESVRLCDDEMNERRV